MKCVLDVLLSWQRNRTRNMSTAHFMDYANHVRWGWPSIEFVERGVIVEWLA